MHHSLRNRAAFSSGDSIGLFDILLAVNDEDSYCG